MLRALVVTGGLASLRTLGEHAAAEEAVLRLRADLDAQAGRALPGRLAAAVAAATRRDAAALGDAVLSPLLGQVGDRDLVVVPTGILITVPWAVLPGCAGRPVTVAPSATAWHTARRRLAAAAQHGPGWPVRRRPPCWSPGRETPAATPRSRQSPRSARAPRCSPGPAATPAAALAGLAAADVAHLAAHGQHQAENALFSTLELAGGPLLGYDLQRAARAPSMVVLSSCDLGLTDVRPGDETFGMVTALLNAGAGTVVASVARVADDTAMATMVGYHQAITAGQPAGRRPRRGPAAGDDGRLRVLRRRLSLLAQPAPDGIRSELRHLPEPGRLAVGCATSNVTPDRFPPASKLPEYWPLLPFGQAT